MTILAILVALLIIIAVYLFSGLVFWGIGAFIVWAFGLGFTWTFWHGLAIAFIVNILTKIFSTKE